MGEKEEAVKEPSFSSRSADNHEDAEAAKSEEASDASNKRLDSDVFRIRSLEKPSPPLLSLLGNVCVILPSAFMHASGKSLDTLIPFVTVNPEFLEKSSDEEPFLALFSAETQSNIVSPCDSTCEITATPTPTWLKKLASRHANGEKTTLSALLLERFRCQVSLAFSERDPSLCVENGSGSSQYASAFEHDGSSTERTDLSLKSLMIDIRSSASSLRLINSKMDAATVSACMIPFVEVLSDTSSCQPRHLKFENLLLVPIQYLSCRTRSVDFSAWNGAIESSLKLITGYDSPHRHEDNRQQAVSSSEVAVPVDQSPTIVVSPIDNASVG